MRGVRCWMLVVRVLGEAHQPLNLNLNLNLTHRSVTITLPRWW